MEGHFEKRLKTRLLLDHPFYGSLLLQLPLIADPGVPTLRTDGTWVKFNPEYLMGLTSAEQLGVLAHEIEHNALLHPYRRAGRDPRGWNEACDYVVNGLLIAAGLALPAGVLLDPQYDGMSAEQVYSKRQSESQPPAPEPETPSVDDKADQPNEEEGPASGQDENEETEQGDDHDSGPNEGEAEDSEGEGEADGQGDSGDEGEGDGAGEGEGEAGSGDGDGDGEPIMGDCPTGEFVDGPATAEQPGDLTERDWEILAEQAALVASRAGHMPGGTECAMRQTREPRVDWVEETRTFITNTVATDLSWSRPNRRFAWKGLYFPGDVKENVGEILVAIDTSASITQRQLDDAASELTSLIREVRPERLLVLYCDTEVRRQVEFFPDDTVELSAVGRGGTRFQPVFDWVENENLQPLAAIYFTDLDGPEPVEPPYPCLWITPAHSTYTAPFGTLVRFP